ncbi:MAG TPA: hypothetical protein VF591_21065 [Pyrinomonadaceae bacterium]|jgi:hypothetical protein
MDFWVKTLALIGSAIVLTKFLLGIRAKKKLVYLVETNQIHLPAGFLYKGRPLRTIFIFKIRILNAGREEVHNPHVTVSLDSGATLIEHRGFGIENVESKNAGHVFTIDFINPGNVYELELYTIDNGSPKAAVLIREAGVETKEYRSKRRFKLLLIFNYLNLKRVPV